LYLHNVDGSSFRIVTKALPFLHIVKRSDIALKLDSKAQAPEDVTKEKKGITVYHHG
jgi:hypothetical protein